MRLEVFLKNSTRTGSNMRNSMSSNSCLSSKTPGASFKKPSISKKKLHLPRSESEQKARSWSSAPTTIRTERNWWRSWTKSTLWPIPMEKEEMIFKSKFYSRLKEYAGVYRVVSRKLCVNWLKAFVRASKLYDSCSASTKKTSRASTHSWRIIKILWMLWWNLSRAGRKAKHTSSHPRNANSLFTSHQLLKRLQKSTRCLLIRWRIETLSFLCRYLLFWFSSASTTTIRVYAGHSSLRCLARTAPIRAAAQTRKPANMSTKLQRITSFKNWRENTLVVEENLKTNTTSST